MHDAITVQANKLLNEIISEKYKMVEVLGPSIHQENFPPEIDVYRIPHNRMKQLVTSVMQILPEIQVGYICVFWQQYQLNQKFKKTQGMNTNALTVCHPMNITGVPEL